MCSPAVRGALPSTCVCVCIIAGIHPLNLPHRDWGGGEHRPHQHSHCSFLCVCCLIWGLNYQKCSGWQSGRTKVDTLNSNPPRESHTNQMCSACSNGKISKSGSSSALLGRSSSSLLQHFTLCPDSVKCESSSSQKCWITLLPPPILTGFLFSCFSLSSILTQESVLVNFL